MITKVMNHIHTCLNSKRAKISLNFVLCILGILGALSRPVAAADVNVLIVGATRDSTDSPYISGTSEAFNPANIASELQTIISGANLGSANVVVEDRAPSNFSNTFPLAAWFYYPYPADVETAVRWPNLRGEKGTDWDYVVIIGDPHTMEKLPGMYAHGVSMVAEEVKKGGAEPILLMPWPAAASGSSVNHYKEVVYRAGRSGDYKVAPAGLAWQAAGSPVGGGHPNNSGAFICASSIYSRIWQQSASNSSNVEGANATLANNVHSTVTTNVGAAQYTGVFNFQSSTLMDYQTTRKFWPRPRGTSTENGMASSTVRALDAAGLTLSSGPGHIRTYVGRDGRYQNGPFMTFGFQYQYLTDDADVHHSQIFWRDFDLADRMLSERDDYRVLPWRILWAEYHRAYPSERPRADREHLNNEPLYSCGSYQFTLRTGRCPLPPKPNPVTKEWLANKIGYVAAWNMGRCQTRAPGFKVMPSSTARQTIDATVPEIMTIQFVLPPKKTVTVNVSSTNPDVTVTPQTLTFTPDNYDQAQSVTVTPSIDLAPGTITNIVYSTSSDDEVYDNLNDSWKYHVNSAPSADDKSVGVITGSYAVIGFTSDNDIVDYPGLNYLNPALTYSVVTQPSKGTLTLNGDLTVIYTPNPGETGEDFFTYKVNDGYLDSEPASVNIIIKPPSSAYGINLITNGSGELGPLSSFGWTYSDRDWYNKIERPSGPRIPGWADRQSPDTLESGTPREPVHGNYYIGSAQGTLPEAFQDIDVTGYSSNINVGRQKFSFHGFYAAPRDQVRMVMECRDSTGQVLSSVTTGNFVGRSQWTLWNPSITAPIGTTHIRVRMLTNKITRGSANGAIFDDLKLTALMPEAEGVQTVDFSKNPVLVYDPRQDGGAATFVQEDGERLVIRGNGWKRIALPYNVTRDTILEFQFKSTTQGEIHSIGFDNDNRTSAATNFQLYGTDQYGIQDHNNYSGSEWKTYRIRVGDYFTGSFSHLVFGMDHDGGARDAESQFSSVKVYEEGQFDGVKNFASSLITAYDSRQDGGAVVSVHSQGSEFRIKGNGWKKIKLPYNVTADTILEFDFKSEVQGEIHGIGFDDDDLTTAATNFQLYGTQNYGVQDFKNYSGTDWKTYRIRVGDYFTGSFTHLVFPMDHDAGARDGESRFKNINIFEEGQIEGVVNLAPTELTAYDLRQDGGAQASVHSQGSELRINGNGWKKINLPYNITADTVLEFEFKSEIQGEIHGIGFDDDDLTTAATNFQLYGTDSYGIQDFNNYSGTDWKTYQIRVGDYFTGSFAYLVFSMDHDSGARDGESYFRNIKIYEENQAGDTVDFAAAEITVYDSNQDTGAVASVHNQGEELRIKGNGWKKIEFPYTLTANTVLEFEFRSGVQGEIHGIGFDNDDAVSKETLFQLYGTQDYGISDFRNYSGTDWKSYQIRVGDHFTGTFAYLVFAMDHDEGAMDGESFFRKVKVYEEVLAPSPDSQLASSFTGQGATSSDEGRLALTSSKVIEQDVSVDNNKTRTVNIYPEVKGYDVEVDMDLGVYRVIYERPRNYLDQGYEYRVLGADNDKGEWKEVRGLKQSVRQLDAETEEVSYEVPSILGFHRFKVESNDPDVDSNASDL